MILYELGIPEVVQLLVCSTTIALAFATWRAASETKKNSEITAISLRVQLLYAQVNAYYRSSGGQQFGLITARNLVRSARNNEPSFKASIVEPVRDDVLEIIRLEDKLECLKE